MKVPLQRTLTRQALHVCQRCLEDWRDGLERHDSSGVANSTGSICREQANVGAHIEDTVSFLEVDAVLQVSPPLEDLTVQEGDIPLTNIMHRPSVREQASFGSSYRKSPFRSLA